MHLSILFKETNFKNFNYFFYAFASIFRSDLLKDESKEMNHLLLPKKSHLKCMLNQICLSLKQKSSKTSS